jgi:ribosome-associated toxin RatA of RatAB toxin-antitoxin module
VTGNDDRRDLFAFIEGIYNGLELQSGRAVLVTPSWHDRQFRPVRFSGEVHVVQRRGVTMKQIRIERVVAIDYINAMDMLADIESYQFVIPNVRNVEILEINQTDEGRLAHLKVFVLMRILAGSVRLRALYAATGNAVRVDVTKGPFELASVTVSISPVNGQTKVIAEANYTTKSATLQRVIENKLGIFIEVIEKNALALLSKRAIATGSSSPLTRHSANTR